MEIKKLKTGDPLLITPSIYGLDEFVATFIQRVPSQGQCKAINYLQAERFVGLYGENDKGLFEMSDYEIARKARPAPEIIAWYNSKEIAGLPGVPDTRQNVKIKAKREDWESRMRNKKGGGVEYHINSLPEITQKHLIAQNHLLEQKES